MEKTNIDFDFDFVFKWYVYTGDGIHGGFYQLSDQWQKLWLSLFKNPKNPSKLSLAEKTSADCQMDFVS